MEDDPYFLATQTRSQSPKQLHPVTEDNDFRFPSPPSLSDPLLAIPDADAQPRDSQSSSSTTQLALGAPDAPWRTHSLHRCKTAPAMAVVRDLKPKKTQLPNPQFESSSIVRQAFFLLLIYLSLGVLIYSFNTDYFSGVETHPVVDALYFCIVTMCTIGYGDIAPLTPLTKVFACVFVLVGFGFIDILLSGVVNYVLDLQENMILTGMQQLDHHDQPVHQHQHQGFSARDYIIDVAKGRMRIRLKVGLALGVVVLCISVGVLFLHFGEDLNWVDSVYLSVMSVTTVGYGDQAFKTLNGRIFAVVWLLLSTLAVARAFLYLAEARVDKRHRRIAKWVLHRDITVEDLLAADINHNGFIRCLFLLFSNFTLSHC
ncbi:Two pore domain potassium channel [Parasponia andersonii]|uniref:Two pore domain potassium channel n=1 Tax=Parasponia andersonii TaxID=3476 RepID=A0A2P5B399_PARAD|nr:Two pore domain potassium channel [Parasponia andersonii]